MFVGATAANRHVLELVTGEGGYFFGMSDIMDSQKTGEGLLFSYWCAKSGKRKRLCFAPDFSRRYGVDGGRGDVRSRSGIIGEGMSVPQLFPERILEVALGRGLGVLFIDEMHMFPGFTIRPVVRAAVEVHNMGVVGVYLHSDFGGRRIPLARTLDKMADERFSARPPVCYNSECKSLAEYNQLIVKGVIPPYEGFKVVVGDVSSGEEDEQDDDQERPYHMFCREHFTWPEIPEGITLPRVDGPLPRITAGERGVIARMKEKDLVPKDYPEDRLI